MLPVAVESNKVIFKENKNNKRIQPAMQWRNAIKEQDAGMELYK